MAQINEWAKSPELRAITGALNGASLPDDVSITDIRNERLAEKYTA